MATPLPAAAPRINAEGPWRRHATVVLVAMAYLSVWPYFERLNNPNENVRVWMTRAIVEYHTLSIDRVSAEWGYVNDKAVSRGHTYSSKAPGASLAGVPVLWVQTRLWRSVGWGSPSKRATTVALRLFTVMMPMVAFLLFFARWVQRRTGSPATRDLLVVGLGAGTMLFPYGVLFVGHAQASTAAFASFMLLSERRPERGPGWTRWPASGRRFLGAGALAGAAVMLEYQVLLIAALLVAYALWSARRRALWFLVGALPFALALGAYHAAVFGRPWEFPYGHLENQSFAQAHSVGYHGLAGPSLAVLGAALFSVRYGLFAYSPFLLLGLAGAACALGRGRGQARAEALLAVAAVVVMSLFIAGLKNPPGWCVGPRYIAGAVPFMVLGLVGTCPLWSGDTRVAEGLRTLAGGLIAVSVFSNGVAAAVYPHYPEVFDNPLFDLALPLVRDGFVPYGLGWAVGLPRAWSLLPPGVFLAAALGLGLAGDGGGWRRAGGRIAAAGAVALVFGMALSRYGRAPSAAERASTAAVRGLWEPRVLKPGAPRR